MNDILNKYTIISNTCTGFSVPEIILGKPRHLIEYTNPFIGTLFLEDEYFIKLCLNYNYYLSQKPIFKEPKENTLWHQQTGYTSFLSAQSQPMVYPVMHLDDIEIHWIHDKKINNITKKFNGRYELEKDLEKIFVWSAPEILNLHTDKNRKKLIDTFLSLENKSIFLTNRQEEVFEDENHISVFINKWENLLETDRTNRYTVKWSDQRFIAQQIIEVIKSKFSKEQK